MGVPGDMWSPMLCCMGGSGPPLAMLEKLELAAPIARSSLVSPSRDEISISMRRSALSELDDVMMNLKKSMVRPNSSARVCLSSIWPKMGWR